MHRTLATLLVVLVVALAGCSGGVPGNGDDADDTDDPGSTDATSDEVAMGTVDFYVSDQPVAIDHFEHLNVTISKVGFQHAGNSSSTNSTSSTNATATPTTATATPTNATATPANATATPEDDGDESGTWIERNVSSRTVDLTQLKGNNATLIGSPQIPAGDYTKVFVYVDSVEGELTDGSEPEFKVPSGKLQLNSGFTLGANSSVSFVYDITVIKRGNSGKYNLLPVIDESGPDQQINRVNATAGRAD